MKREKKQFTGVDKKNAAVCGLYCEACSLFIATAEEPARLKGLAARFQLSEEAIRCYGCRSNKRWPYCEKCKMFECATKRGIDFCIECDEYPCDDLKQFQAAMPHRIDLWDDLKRIKTIGCVFRPNPATCSDANRPLIPIESGHRFRSIPATF
jgi:hypothetical protein